VVGGGIAGLVAAITAAEEGAPVVLHEASPRLGGRALAGPVGGGDGRPGLNLGPRVLHTDGAVCRWVRRRGLPVPLRRPAWTSVRVVAGPGALRWPLAASALLAPTVRDRPAPVDVDFRTWAAEAFGPERGALMCRLAGLFTYHHDPGSASARFVWERYRRTFVSMYRVRYVEGGWPTLVGALAERAAELGVEVRTGAPVRPGELPDGPTVVAASLRSAGRVLGRDLRWPGARTALVDVELDAAVPWPETVADVRPDLGTCCLVDRALTGDVALVQAQLGLGPGVTLAAGVARIEATFDAVVPGWRDRARWRREQLVADASGAVDPPGATWRDRPAVDQGDDVFLAGDAVAAPGMLAEVSVNSAVRAARLAVAARRRRAWAPGWPAVDLTPDRRLAILAAALPGAELRTAPPAGDGPEPVDETGEGYRLRAGARGADAVATAPGGERTVLRWRRPWRDAVAQAARAAPAAAPALGRAVRRPPRPDVSRRRPGAPDIG
jgi:hypothetical protein